uniref:SERPIN domain-containing protein n=1 Tax=Globodera pallida TaxID=36090 RepID=A0A183C7A5_GLOPA
MAYAGAKENTSQEIGQLLAKSAPESAVHEYFGELIKAVKKRSRNYTLDVANKMYVMDGLDVLKAFKTVINRHYGGQFEVVDFEESVESAKKINRFVEKVTHDKIHDLISPDMFNDMTRLVLINAVYFKGDWANKFRVAFTKKKTFYIDENNTEELDMMCQKDLYTYYADKELQLLGMPYKGDEMFMFVLLPKERFGLAKMLAKLDGKSLLKLVKKRNKQRVEVELPKFRLESTHDLNGPLTKLGMSTAFSDSANFQGIAETDEPLKIDKMVQKAFIELVNLRNRLCRFHLIGPKAIAFLRKVIRLVSDDELDEQSGDFEPFREMHRWWRDLPANVLPGNLQDGQIAALLVEDPRLFRAVPTPPQQQQYNDQHRLVHPTSDDHSRRPPPSAASLFSDWQFFHQNLLPKRLTHSEFETLCAGKLMRPRKTDFKIPISIVFRRISIPSPSIKNFALNCVDLICPSGVGYDFWLALQFGGFRAIGIHDKRALDFEAGIGTFPDDCADCCAGKLATQMEAKSLMEKFERKPCNRRVPYGEELNVAHPFTFEWDKLLAEWSSNGQHRRQQKGTDEEANKLPFFILRDRQALKRLDLWLRRSRSTEQQQHSSSTAQPMLEECFGTSSRDSVLVPVFLRMKRRGVPKRLALISLPTDQDLQLLNGSAAAEHGGGGGDRMVMNNTVIIREEARKSRKQNGMDGTSTSAEDDDDEEEEEEDRKAASSSSARHIPEFISLSQHEQQQRGVEHFFPSVEECEQQLLSLEAIFPDGADDKDRRRKARNVRKRVKKRAKMISNRKEAAAAPEGGGEASGGGGPSMEMQMEIGDESERQPTEEATRKLIGRVVRGDYAFTSAQGMALGFVPLGALEAVVRTGGIVLVRNTSSKYYHPAQLHIHSVEQNI